MPDRDKALFGFLAPGGQVLAAAFRDQAKGRAWYKRWKP